SEKQGKDGSGPLQLPIAGSATTGGVFAGTLSVERFEARGDQVVAMGSSEVRSPGRERHLSARSSCPSRWVLAAKGSPPRTAWWHSNRLLRVKRYTWISAP